jgi:hypothetical protein
MPIPAKKMDVIEAAVAQFENVGEIIRRLFWATSTSVENTLITFLGEFLGIEIRISFCSTSVLRKSQRLALGLPDAII